MNVLIEGVPADKHWRVVRAGLDVIEPGAASHALQHTPLDDGHEQYRHVRLGLSITLSDKAIMPPMPTTPDEWADLADHVMTWAAAVKDELDTTGGTRQAWNAWQCLLDAANRLRSIGYWQARDEVPT